MYQSWNRHCVEVWVRKGSFQLKVGAGALRRCAARAVQDPPRDKTGSNYQSPSFSQGPFPCMSHSFDTDMENTTPTPPCNMIKITTGMFFCPQTVYFILILFLFILILPFALLLCSQLDPRLLSWREEPSPRITPSYLGLK